MTPDERKALVERMAEVISQHDDCDHPDGFRACEPSLCPCRKKALAALAVAEPVVREACARWHDEQAAGEHALYQAAEIAGDRADMKRHHAAGWEHEQSARHFRARGAA